MAALRSQRSFLRVSDTQCLLIGLLLGYAGFVLWLGIRSIVLVSGAVIVGVAIAVWYAQRPSKSTSLASTNLLQADVFLGQIGLLNDEIPDASQSLWRSVQQQAQAIQQIAMQLAQQEPTFIPDLLETLHTALDLVDQLVRALQVTQQVQTPRYRELAQQQLQASLDRLQQTHDQLQELRDQIAFEGLRPIATSAAVSTRLQTLIADNASGILGD